MATTLNNFLQQLTDSGLVSAEELQQIQSRALAAKSGTEDAAELARELVKQKKLTKFQAEQLYAGKGKSLTLGNYVLLDKLGEGGMGMVLKAWHRRMERIVALKVIAPKVVKEPSALKRFQREVIAAAKLTHPNIVAAHDADEAKGTHFLVMEYVEGSDLSSWVKEHGPLPVEQAVSCIVQAARGLAFAHDQGVVHRDIKPHNLLMDHSGTVKILDMGLARIEGGFGGSAEHADLTRSGAMMGTVDYMSPEQAMDSKHADARSDIYSLGCTLFYLVTGHVAFEADTVMKRLTAHQSAPPPALDQEVQSVYSGTSSGAQGSSATRLPSVLPAHLVALNAVFQRMVAKKPEDRQQSMLQVVAELDRCAMSGSATVSVASGSNPVAKPSTPANVSNRDADTIIDSSSDSKTNGLSDATVVLDSSVVKNPTTGATTSSIKSRKMILISVVTVALLLVIAWAMSGKSGKPPAENDKEVAQVEKTSSGRPVASSSEHSTDHALEFDGDDLVSMESVPEYSTESMTLEAFVRVDSIPQDGFIYSLGGNGGLQVMANGGRWWFAMVGHQGGWFSLPSSEPIPLQRRVHLAGVCDKSEFRLYVDGKLIGQPKSTIGSKFKPPGGAALIGLNLCGTIDEVRVSKTARYSAAFTPAARHESDADTLALYHFDEGQGDRLVDSSGNNHHGKIVGAKWVKADSSAIAPALANAAVGAPATTASATPQPSALDAALKFDGLQSHVQTPLVHGGNTPLTIEFTLLPGPRQNAVISDSEAMGMGIDILNNSISFLAFRRVNDKADYVRITAPRSLAADRAYRIATVYDNGTLWLFVDGKLEASADLKGEYLPSNLPFYLGASPEGEGIDYPYTGTLDEVRFSKVARYKTDYSPVARLTTDTDTLALYHFDEGTGEVLKDSSGSDHHGKIVGAKWVKADVAAVSHVSPHPCLRT